MAAPEQRAVPSGLPPVMVKPTGLVMPERILAWDAFTDTDGTTVQDHTPTGGGTWTKHSSSTADATIQSNRAAGPTTSNIEAYYHSLAPPSPDYDVSCDVVRRDSSTANNGGPAGRMIAAATHMYMARLQTQGVIELELWKLVSGVATKLGNVSFAQTVGVPYRVTLRMRGTRISALVDGVELIAVTDTTAELTAAGRAGFRLGGTANTGIAIDNWRVSR